MQLTYFMGFIFRQNWLLFVSWWTKNWNNMNNIIFNCCSFDLFFTRFMWFYLSKELNVSFDKKSFFSSASFWVYWQLLKTDLFCSKNKTQISQYQMNICMLICWKRVILCVFRVWNFSLPSIWHKKSAYIFYLSSKTLVF